ncbi:MAG: hypothetical protein R3E48_16740 [Burkholderiaceae bacterium]
MARKLSAPVMCHRKFQRGIGATDDAVVHRLGGQVGVGVAVLVVTAVVFSATLSAAEAPAAVGGDDGRIRR